jgi:hypothetical protein
MPGNRPTRGTVLPKTQHPHEVINWMHLEHLASSIEELQLLVSQNLAAVETWRPLLTEILARLTSTAADTGEEPYLVTYAEAARRLSCDPKTISRMVGDGELERVYVRGAPRITTMSINAYSKRDGKGQA